MTRSSMHARRCTSEWRGGGLTGRNGRIYWKKQPPVRRAGQWIVPSWRKRRKYLHINLGGWISPRGQRAPCLCPLGPHPSLALSDHFPLNHAPPPVLFFSPGTGICGASPQKNKIKHSYLQTVIRRRT